MPRVSPARASNNAAKDVLDGIKKYASSSCIKITMKIRLGYWDKTFAETLYYPAGEAHGLLCSPTRGGKFRDVIAQILLSFEGSCFVIDPSRCVTSPELRQPGVKPKKFARLSACLKRLISPIRDAIATAL